MSKSALVLTAIVFVLTVTLIVLNLRSVGTNKGLIIINTLDLGEVSILSKKEFEVTLTNTTNNVFEIAKVYTSCGCTRVADQSLGSRAFSINPKSFATVKFEFDPSSMHAKGDDIDHELYFLVSNPVEQEYKTKITGKVI